MTPGHEGYGVLLVLGSWVGVRRLFHLSLLLTAPRVVLPQDPRTGAPGHEGYGGIPLHAAPKANSDSRPRGSVLSRRAEAGLDRKAVSTRGHGRVQHTHTPLCVLEARAVILCASAESKDTLCHSAMVCKSRQPLFKKVTPTVKKSSHSGSGSAVLRVFSGYSTGYA